MQLQLSSSAGVPIYQQIVNQVRHLIAAGRLQPGEDLPPIRSLAEQLTINPNTVARAYLELERGGIVTKRHGSGTYVSVNVSPLPQREKLKVLRPRVDALLVEAAHLNVALGDVVDLLRERHETIHPMERK
jgi:GntR family transcriptional regulator